MKTNFGQISCLVCVEYQTLKMIICHFLKATREYSHHARLMSEPPGIISVLRFRPPRSVVAAPPLLFGHLLLRKWDSFEKSEECWYQSCYVTVWPVCCYCLDNSNTLQYLIRKWPRLLFFYAVINERKKLSWLFIRSDVAGLIPTLFILFKRFPFLKKKVTINKRWAVATDPGDLNHSTDIIPGGSNIKCVW